MASIDISEMTYKRLLSLKSEHETFDDLLLRLIGNNDLHRLIGILPKKKVDELDRLVTEQREQRDVRYLEEVERMMENDS